MAEAQRSFGHPRIQRHAAALAGTPAMSVPCGFTANGLPIGLQLMARAGGEPAILAAAAAYQGATTWHDARPALADLEVAAR